MCPPVFLLPPPEGEVEAEAPKRGHTQAVPYKSFFTGFAFRSPVFGSLPTSGMA